MDQSGATFLIQWLEPLSEKVYPNVNLQQGVLECLDKLNVQPPDIEDKVIYKVLSEYVQAREISQPIRRLALALKDKWEHLKAQRATYFEDEMAAAEDEDNEEIMERNSDKYEQYRMLQEKIEQFKRMRMM